MKTFALLTVFFCLVCDIRSASTANYLENGKLFISNDRDLHLNVILTLKNSTSSILDSLKMETFADRIDRINRITKMLKEFTTAAQTNVVNFLQAEQTLKGFTMETLWVTNQVIIWRADRELLHTLTMSFEEIEKIEDEKFIELDDPIDEIEFFDSRATGSNLKEHHWGVDDIDAPRVWQEGIKGSGVVVATIDTGVRYTHEALVDSFLGDYGWYSPANKTTLPTDVNGHGTHTMGTIVGATLNIGVSPGSKWMSCQGCHKRSCSDINLLLCGQWMICPTKPDGSHADCSKAPHLVSNSWGGSQGNPWFAGVVRAWQAIGIVPLFAAGNSGPKCGTVMSPGDYNDVISVGATTVNRTVSVFSSVGPTKRGDKMKPEIAAPGSKILSSSYRSDTGYALMSGTSMACPHAAGLTALVISQKPELTFAQLKAVLMDGTVPTVSKGSNCGGVADDQFPNYHAGSGKINAIRTFQNLGFINASISSS